ncbi:MAG TPA: hypothetical protein VFI38_05615 [Candidatus Acidoferrum sp.]|nr:hypothetical protein [Candidatus Acidoferrum sp.]
MNNVGLDRLSAVLDLVSQIPSELLTMKNETYNSFILGKARITAIIGTWVSNQTANAQLQRIDFHGPQNPLKMIHDALAECPDEAPTPRTAELSFISDPELRANLRSDIGAIERALSNGEWKAATVLAGSAAEALLLWALKQRRPADITSAIAAAKTGGELTTVPNGNLDRWNLHEYIEVAAKLGVIKPNTAKQTRLARDFRNFIHPGVAERLGERCDRATALSAVAGMEHIVRDFTP